MWAGAGAKIFVKRHHFPSMMLELDFFIVQIFSMEWKDFQAQARYKFIVLNGTIGFVCL